jgi:polysaccharide export outer membrane protein
VRRHRLALVGLLLGTAAAGQAAPAAPAAPVTLRPGDVIQVQLPREPDLSGEFVIDERGFVALPILGLRAVTGSPWPIVRDSLLAAYAHELAESSVGLLAFRRVFVFGSVTKPGVYLADPSLSLAGAVAMAGGATAEGDLRKLRVVRDGETILARAPIDSPLAAVGVQSGDQIFVGRRGWFDRNSATAVSAFVGLAGVIVTLIIFR